MAPDFPKPVSAKISGYLNDEGIYKFLVKVLLEDGRLWEMSRVYGDFYDLQMALLKTFPTEIGKKNGLHALPALRGFLDGATDTVAESMLPSLDTYIKDLLDQPHYISPCNSVEQFFLPRKGDCELQLEPVNESDHALEGYRSKDRLQKTSTTDVNMARLRGWPFRRGEKRGEFQDESNTEHLIDMPERPHNYAESSHPKGSANNNSSNHKRPTQKVLRSIAGRSSDMLVVGSNDVDKVEAAHKRYIEGAVLLQRVWLSTTNTKAKQELDKIHRSYVGRIEGLNRLIMELKTRGDALLNDETKAASGSATNKKAVDGFTNNNPTLQHDSESIMSSDIGDFTGSLPESSLFDRDLQSKVTYPTTTTTLEPTTKNEAVVRGYLVENTPNDLLEREQDEAVPKATEIDALTVTDDSFNENLQTYLPEPDDDAMTTYSVDSNLDNPEIAYLEAFSDQLSRELNDALDDSALLNMEPEYLEAILKRFAWKLHGESSNPFEWGASVTLHRNRKEIVKILYRTHDAGSSEAVSVVSGTRSIDSEAHSIESETPAIEEDLERHSFRKPVQVTIAWLNQVESSTLDESNEERESVYEPQDNSGPFQFAEYEQFVRSTGAYKWLVSSIRRHGQLSLSKPDVMSGIGEKVLKFLRSQKPLRHISGAKPSPNTGMEFKLDWNPASLFLEESLDTNGSETLENLVCLTGALFDAQATTVGEYMSQTWPETGKYLINLIKKLVLVPEGSECSYQIETSRITSPINSADFAWHRRFHLPRLWAKMDSASVCVISATGDPYFVSEIAEQISWLASAIRIPPYTSHQGVILCTPNVQDLKIDSQGVTGTSTPIKGSCNISFNFKQIKADDVPNGSKGLCWGQLFWNPILVCGYPILSRPKQNTGLEMSLSLMARLIGSSQVVQWDKSIIIKGFNSLVVSTLAVTGMVVWHLLVSSSIEERISYIDPNMEKLEVTVPDGYSLRNLEESRHFIGWCSNVIDMCGKPAVGFKVRASGLQKPPAQIVIDRLYVEGGSELVTGLNLGLNKRQKPFWLERENDYPSLLKWISLQPIIFYDVSERRAWLVDGVSALLHLVRISLYRDEHDPESPYDWVFDEEKFKDQWDGFTGRHAAMKTLKTWNNLNLNIYITDQQIRDGKLETRYATLRSRVEKILHSIEILVDRQVKIASEDGIKVSQTLDPRRSILGFDILDVLSPLGPIHSRVQYIESWGPGWRDLLSPVGITTIFGNGFGSLIRPNDPSSMCTNWRSVPKNSDYMAASLSTLKMLHERRLSRMEPGLSIGELTKKVVWVSPCDPLKPCQCLGMTRACDVSPIQFLVPKKSWNPRLVANPMRPVDITCLDDNAAVIFGHMPLLGPAKQAKSTGHRGKEKAPTNDSDTPMSPKSVPESDKETSGSSTKGSTSNSSLTPLSTSTVPSTGPSINDDKNNSQGSRRWKERWNNWRKK